MAPLTQTIRTSIRASLGALAACLALAAAGPCAAGGLPDAIAIEPGASSIVLGDRALVLLTFSNLDGPITGVRFNVAHRSQIMFEFSKVPAGKHLYAFLVAPGEYCIQKFFSGRTKVESDPENQPCFTVVSGHINHPGTLAVWGGTSLGGSAFSGSAQLSGSVQVGFAIETATLPGLIAGRYPALFKMDLPWHFGRPLSPRAEERLLDEISDAVVSGGHVTLETPFGRRAARDAWRTLGDGLRTGSDGLARDPARALEAYLVGASLGDGRAAAIACQQLDVGWGVPADPTRAAALCAKGAAANDPVAAWFLARMHARERGGLVRDPQREAELMRLVGDEGIIGETLLEDTWGDQDEAGAFPDGEGFAQVARARSDRGDSGGTFALAFYYANGIGVPRDGARAIELYESIAPKRWSQALVRIALLYWKGEAVPRDLTKAKEYFERAAALNERNTPDLAWFLAVVDDAKLRDPKRALRLITDAIESAGSDSDNLDTQAAAHAALGQWKAALKRQREAIAAARATSRKPKVIAELEARLARYEAKQPYTQ
jgi:tetratricopeptide (TPR) repeat protein